jgi:hypothetical protein
MTSRSRLTIAAALAAACSLAVVHSARAQAIATFGSLEASGLGEGSALLGTSISGGRMGWVPVVTLIGQVYRFNIGDNTTNDAYAFSPSIGLQDNMSHGMVQASVGYSFVGIHGPQTISPFNGAVLSNFPSVIGVQTGTSNSMFVSAQGNYWGDGENTAQVIGNYAFKSEYYWTRFRSSHRVASGANPVYLGGELVFQGTQNSNPGAYRYQVGPTIEYRVTPNFRVGASGGYRGGNRDSPGTGYARIEFLALTKM